MALTLHSEDILFTNITEGSGGTVSQIISHDFKSDVKTGDIVLKSFKLSYKSMDHNFYENAAEITNVSLDGHSVTGKLTLQLSDKSNNTLDPDKVYATVLFIADCE